MAFTIGFYEIDRAYGGAEEGGWYFDTGNLARAYRVIKNEDKAYEVARRANHLLRFFQKQNRRVRDVGSAAYNGGAFSAFVFEDALPACFPEERPHYE